MTAGTPRALPTATRRLGEPAESLMARVRARYEGKPLTNTALLERCATTWPEKEAVVSKGVRWTFAELAKETEQLAAGLAGRLGIPPGSRIGLLVGNRAEYVALFFSIARSWAVVPLNTHLTARELGFIVDDAGIDVVVTERRHLAVLAELAERRPLSVVVLEPPSDDPSVGEADLDTVFAPLGDVFGYAELRDSGTPPPPPEQDEHATAAVYYTSGTTGDPKGAELSHLNTVAGAFQYAEGYGCDDSAVTHLTTAPLFHVQYQVFVPSTLQAGGTVVVTDFSPAKVFDVIEHERVNAMFAVPSMLFILMAHECAAEADCSSVRVLQYGGSPMPTARVPEIERLFPNAALLQGFGQTESTGLIAVSLPDETTVYPLSTGRAISGTEIRIVDEAGRTSGAGKAGEIVVRGPQVMKGYLGLPEASAEALRDGWLHTGDIGRLDEVGRLFVIDRKKDLIIRGGQNIYPVEVEEVLMRHPGVDQCAVVGQPHDIYVEVPVAFVVLRGTARSVTAEELGAHCARSLAPFKVPTEFRLLEELPRTASGKVQKFELRQRFSVSGSP